MIDNIHKNFIEYTLKLAEEAKKIDEVPIGAIIVRDSQIIAEAYNLREKNQSVTGHAEILAIEKAAKKLNSWRLSDCTLYVSLEPCLMCAGALIQSRIQSVYFGAFDPKGGALGSLYQLHEDKRLNHRFTVIGGICQKDCGAILSEYFKSKRQTL